MVQTDPIADMLTVIRNGLMVRKETVECPYSTMKENILSVLKAEGFIVNFKVMEPGPAKKALKVYLKYGPKGQDIINRIERVSKPGRRIYSKIGDLGKVRSGLGVNILSTSKGVISDKDARAQNVGGEVICRVW
jgi:small subunit ribosomal protein S8